MFYQSSPKTKKVTVIIALIRVSGFLTGYAIGHNNTRFVVKKGGKAQFFISSYSYDHFDD